MNALHTFRRKLVKIFRPKRFRYRSAVSGLFVSEAFAKANPDTTVREQV